MEQLDEFTAEKKTLAKNIGESTTEMVELKETSIDEEKLFSSKMGEVGKDLLIKQEQINSLQNKKANLMGTLSKSKVSEQDFIQLQETLEETKIKAKSLTSENNEELNQLSTNKIKLEKKYNEIELLNLQVA